MVIQQPRPPVVPTGEALDLLAHSCGVAQEGSPHRLVEFIAARDGEGTSTVALAFAESLVRLSGGTVLLVDASSGGGIDEVGLMEAMIAGLPVERAVTELGEGVFGARLSGIAHLSGELMRRVGHRELWRNICERYDRIVVDAPALERSNRGITLAEHMDAVVIVVEAEATRGPVLGRLIDLLQRTGAPVVGTVLNKRKYYIPKSVYRWL